MLSSAWLVTTTLQAADPAGSGPEPAIVYSDVSLPTWQLQDDDEAQAMFVGDACGFCTDSEWSLRRHFPE